MAPVISPLFPPDKISNPPLLDLLPSEFADSSPFLLPRPATPWPLRPSSSLSPSPLLVSLSEPDLLPCSLPYFSPMSIVGDAPPLDFGLLSSSPVPLSFTSRVSSSAINSSSPSLSLIAPDGHSLDPVLMEDRSSSSVLLDSSDVCDGTKGLLLKCPVEQNNLGAPVAIPAFSSHPSCSLAPSKQCSSSSMPMEKALNPGVNSATPRSQSAGSASSPTGVSWASVVEKRIIGGKPPLQFFPPNCPDMENIILSPPPEVTQQSANLWDSTLVGYFVGNPVHFNAVNNITKKIWKRFELQHVAGD